MSGANSPPKRENFTPTGVGVLAELCLVVVSLVTAAAFCRTFDGWGFLRILTTSVLGSHAVAAVARRIRFGLLASFPVSVVVGAVVLSNLFYRSTTTWALPSRRTWDIAGVELRAALTSFPTEVPPVPATGGYLLAAAAALWLAVFLADSFAFRARATPETALPTGVLFLFASAVASDRLRTPMAAAWIGSVLAFVVVHRAWRRIDNGGWLSDHSRGAGRSLVRSGVLIGALGVLAAVVVTPRFPGARAEALVDTKRTGPDTVFVLSPLVDIKKRVSSRSDTELFSVQSPIGTYWRATALPDFDGRQWTSDLEQQDARDALTTSRIPNGDKIVAEFTIAALTDVWMPSPFVPTALISATMKNEPRWDAGTGTLLVPGSLKKNDIYRVSAVVSRIDPAVARVLSNRPARALPPTYLALPADYPAGLVTLAREVTAAGDNPFDKARLLQDWFRTEFVYDLGVSSGQETDDIEGFLESRRGYCEQFSGTFAAMARSLGIPARVAVGFTSGQLGPDGRYHVQAKHAHAWPEIYVTGLGWIGFEPTPGRGNPTSENYTGVSGAQAGDPAADPNALSSTTTINPNVSTSAAVPRGADIPSFDDTEGLINDVQVQKSSSRLVPWLVGLVVFAGVAVLYPRLVRTLVNRRWRKRRTQAPSISDEIRVVWNRATHSFERSGLNTDPSETAAEFAERAAHKTPVDAQNVRDLALLVTASTFGDGEVTERHVRDAELMGLKVAADLEAHADRRTKIRWKYDPRPVVKSLPGDHRQARFEVGERS